MPNRQNAFFEVRKDTSGMPVLRKWYKAKNERREPHRQPRKRRPKSETEEDDEPKPYRRRVFLYLQLQGISDLPPNAYNMRLQLRHSKDTVTKLDDHSNHKPSVDLEALEEYKPTFSIVIEQDNVDDLNVFSDHPLIITLQRCIPHQKDDTELTEEDTSDGDEDNTDTEDEEDENFETVACGFIDLLESFTQGRAIFTIEAFLYPTATTKGLCNTLACKSVWEVYTLQPLLKNISFSNIVYITFEAIYNANPALLSVADQIRADLFFQSKIPNEQQAYDKIKICSFNTFTKSVIAEQSIHQTWESINTDMPEPHFQCMGGYTGCTISIHKLFKALLCPEQADLGLNEIQLGADMALVANSVHRYILTDELANILQDAVVFNRQHILIELYNANVPHEILMSGHLELPILLYPQVNCCRFAVELQTATQPKNGKLNKKESRLSHNASKETKTFAIINICLQSPMAERAQLPMPTELPVSQITHYNFELDMSVQPAPVLTNAIDILMAIYRNFDEQIEMLANYVVQHKIKSLEDAKPYFNEQMEQLTDSITKLVARDFNLRFPSKSNREFTNLMTIAYREFVQRIYTILQNFSAKRLECNTHDATTRNKLLRFMNIAKLAYEVGDATLGEFIFGKLKKLGENDPYWNFFIFLYDMEKLDYDAAQQYLLRPAKERYADAAYYEHWAHIYLHYLKIKDNEQSNNEAMGFLLESVKLFTIKQPRDLEAWVLLHCLYCACCYTPGVSFTRLKFEDLYNAPRREFPIVPKCRWDMYLNYEMKFKSRKYSLLYTVMQVFLRLGVYQFAQMVYTEMAKACTEAEKYFLTTTFKILLHEMPQNYVVKTFNLDNLDKGELLKALEAQTNGHLEYHRRAPNVAVKHYERIMDAKYLASFESFELGLLRYAYYMAQQRKYDCVIKALGKCTILGTHSIITYLALGKAMYRLNRLPEAEMYFAQCTQYEMHLPDVWAFLSVINLKMGYICKAIEFWKYAKLNPDNIISEEILHEFNKITSKKHSHLVDKPER